MDSYKSNLLNFMTADEYTGAWERLVRGVESCRVADLKGFIDTMRNFPIGKIILSNDAKLIHHAIQMKLDDIVMILINECDDLTGFEHRTLYPAICHGRLNLIEYFLHRSDLRPDSNATFQYAIQNIFCTKNQHVIPIVHVQKDFSIKVTKGHYPGKFPIVIPLLAFDKRFNISAFKYDICKIASTYGYYELFKHVVEKCNVDVFTEKCIFLTTATKERHYKFVVNFLKDYGVCMEFDESNIDRQYNKIVRDFQRENEKISATDLAETEAELRKKLTEMTHNKRARSESVRMTNDSLTPSDPPTKKKRIVSEKDMMIEKPIEKTEGPVPFVPVHNYPMPNFFMQYPSFGWNPYLTNNYANGFCMGPSMMTGQPTWLPFEQPTGLPFEQPTWLPFEQPTGLPFEQPTGLPFEQPTGLPFEQPAGSPFEQPTGLSFRQPTGLPFEQPTGSPFEQQFGHPTNYPQ